MSTFTEVATADFWELDRMDFARLSFDPYVDLEHWMHIQLSFNNSPGNTLKVLKCPFSHQKG